MATNTITPARTEHGLVRHIWLLPDDGAKVDALTRAVLAEYGASTAPALLAAAPELAHRLPAALVCDAIFPGQFRADERLAIQLHEIGIIP